MLFISPQKLFSFSRYLSFCLDFLVKVNFKFYDVAAWLTNNCNTHIAPRYCNQTIKFGQLIELTWETFFLKNHSQNMVEKLVPDPFLKNQNWAYLWINSLKFYRVCFYCMASWGLLKHIEIKLQTTCFHLILSFFKK